MVCLMYLRQKLLQARKYPRTIHFYEACLATLAILVWHLYFVILSPNIYPMSTVWLTGKISEEEMEDEHPLELQRLKTKSEK